MRPALLFALACAVSLATHVRQPSVADLKTTAEASGYKSTSTYHLLEPMSDDGLVAWNFLDDQLNDSKTYPILRRQ